MQRQVKDTHLATSIEALNRIALTNSQTSIQNRKPSSLMKVAKTIYSKSQSDPYDEEMTYILLSRFIQVYDRLMIVHNDKNFVSMMLGKEARSVKAQHKDIKQNLMNRYMAGVELDTKQTFMSQPPLLQLKTPETPEPPQIIEILTSKVFASSFITCLQLFNAHSKNVNLLIMDTRSTTDFAESQLKDLNCINVPDSCILPGLSAHKLGEGLPSTSMRLWEKRDTFDAIVILDWNTSKTTYVGSKVEKLRTILVEWDVGKKYPGKPVILNYGYLEWIDQYPMLCTNAAVKVLKANLELDDLLDLDNIEYPTESTSKPHDVFSEELMKHSENIKILSSGDDLLKEEQMVIEETSKVTKQLLKHEEDWKTIHDQISNEYDIAKIQRLKETEKQTEDEISKLTQEENELVVKKAKLANDFSLSVSFEPSEAQSEDRTSKLITIQESEQKLSELVKKRVATAAYRQQLLDTARRSKKPEEKSSSIPVIDRRTKPKEKPIVSFVKRIEGKLKPVSFGLTGLVNIKNTCYMNSILQCVRHIPELIDFYCNGDYINQLHSLKPLITTELAHLIRALWSNSYTVIRPIEFYSKFTFLAPVYKGGNHEDCMEFFVTLYTFLSEDCSLELPAKKFWSETQLAWHDQHGGKISYYINSMYHQIRVQQTCKQCKDSNLKFDIENVFYLSVPSYTFKLVDMMDEYLHNYDEVVCRKCNKPKDVQKTLVFYPNILVVALKRQMIDYVENGVVHLKKNESPCFFPLDDFRVGDVLYTLRGVALHVGSLKTGHYTAACRNPTNDRWYLFNDEQVTEIDMSDSSLRTKAYAFFYSRKTARPLLRPSLKIEGPPKPIAKD